MTKIEGSEFDTQDAKLSDNKWNDYKTGKPFHLSCDICDLSHLLDSLYQVPAISSPLFFVLALASEEGILGPC